MTLQSLSPGRQRFVPFRYGGLRDAPGTSKKTAARGLPLAATGLVTNRSFSQPEILGK